VTANFAATLHQLRPAWWLCLWAHFLLGSVFILGGRTPCLPFSKALEIAVSGGIWAVCLGGGAAGITAAFTSRRTDIIGVGEAALHAGYAGLGLMLTGLVAAVTLSWWLFDVYLAGIIIVVIAATPPLRLARKPVSAAFCAAVFAAITFYAGCVAVASLFSPDLPLTLALIGFGFLVLAAFVVTEAPATRLTPALYLVCLTNALVCLGLAQFRLGRNWGIATLVIPFLGWAVLGVYRYSGKGKGLARPSSAAVIALCLLTDATIATSMIFL